MALLKPQIAGKHVKAPEFLLQYATYRLPIHMRSVVHELLQYRLQNRTIHIRIKQIHIIRTTISCSCPWYGYVTVPSRNIRTMGNRVFTCSSSLMRPPDLGLHCKSGHTNKPCGRGKKRSDSANTTRQKCIYIYVRMIWLWLCVIHKPGLMVAVKKTTRRWQQWTAVRRAYASVGWVVGL
jgi:hypothetical protein